MRTAAFALTCLAIMGGISSTGFAQQPAPAPAAVPAAPDDTGYYHMSDPNSVWGDPQECPPDTSGWFTPPQNCWYLQAGALFLYRSHVKDQVILVNDTTGGSALRTKDTDFNNIFQAGPEITFGRRFDSVSAIEGTWWGTNHWQQHTQVVGANNLSLPGPIAVTTGDFFLADQVDVKYQSNLNNVEANYKQTMFNVTLLGGFRYFNLHEVYEIRSSDFDSGTSPYRVKTHNNLMGGQIGLGFNKQCGRFGVDFISKAGLYGNAARLETYLGDFNNTVVLRNYKDNETITSFIGELNAQATYNVTDWFLIRAGYRILWLEGIALAPQQLDFTADPNAGNHIIDRAGLYLYGFNIGCEARW